MTPDPGGDLRRKRPADFAVYHHRRSGPDRPSLARRPGNGQYELSPPLVASTVDRFARDVEGLRDERTGVRGIFEIDEITMIACPDLMRAYEANLLDLEQVHGIMEMMISMCEGSANGDVPNPPNRMVVLDPPRTASNRRKWSSGSPPSTAARCSPLCITRG